MAGKRLLLVDDEATILKGLKYALEQDGYQIDVAYDGEEAVAVFGEKHYDLVLLDVMLPKMDGMEVCQRIRANSSVPIIMLTAKGEDMDKIIGLEYGADDYMTKPFNILEVKARVKSLLRRSGIRAEADAPNIINIHALEINIEKRNVSLDGKDLKLTAKEFDMLYLLIKNRGRVYSREELLELLWSNDFSGDLRTVDVHIRRLREKIEPVPAKPEFIITKWGVGYYFTDR